MHGILVQLKLLKMMHEKGMFDAFHERPFQIIQMIPQNVDHFEFDQRYSYLEN